MLRHKKFLIIACAVLLLSAAFNYSVFARNTEVAYPTIPGAITPTQTKTFLPEYVMYVFSLAIIISALIAFGLLIYAGIRWMTSAGSPQAINDAKDRMKSGFLGLITILASYLILNTINPQLVVVNPGIEVNWGITLYTDSACNDPNNAKKIIKSVASEDNPNNPGQFRTIGGAYLKFNDGVPAYSLDVIMNNDDTFHSEDRGCQSIGYAPTSATFIWKMPGVYLVKTDGKTEKFLPASTATLGDFDDSVAKVKFLDIQQEGIPGINFGAVVHEDPYWKGSCQALFGKKGEMKPYDLSGTSPVGTNVSSISNFIWSDQPGPGGVVFYEHDNFNGGNFAAKANTASDIGECNKVPNDNWATSMKISGNYLAVLFEKNDCKGKCEVFESSDSNFGDNEIGRCGCFLFGWGCEDCLSSYMVIPTK